MPIRKKLKTNGSNILDFMITINKVKSRHADVMIEVLDLRIHTDDGEFAYEICSDTRVPDLVQVKTHIYNSLRKAKNDFLNVEISEYTERNYLHFIVQNIEQQQYTGRRI